MVNVVRVKLSLDSATGMRPSLVAAACGMDERVEGACFLTPARVQIT